MRIEMEKKFLKAKMETACVNSLRNQRTKEDVVQFHDSVNEFDVVISPVLILFVHLSDFEFLICISKLKGKLIAVFPILKSALLFLHTSMYRVKKTGKIFRNWEKREKSEFEILKFAYTLLIVK